MPKRRYRKPGDLYDLQCMLWTLMRELEDRVFERGLMPLTLEDLVRVSHAMGQLSGSYLKLIELGELAQQMSQLEQLMHENGNGHGR
jgi:hypothetical protein